MTGRGLLLSELDKLTGNISRMLALIKPEHHGYTPQEGMRTLAQLATHLAQIPHVDLRLLRGDDESQIVALEAQLAREDPDGWISVLKDGKAELTRYYERLTLDEFENNSGTAYYGRTQTHAQWLVEIIGHLYHHRAQLFMYLKLNHYPVGTRTLYE